MKTFNVIQEEISKTQRFVFKFKDEMRQVVFSVKLKTTNTFMDTYVRKSDNYVLLGFLDLNTYEYVVKYIDSNNRYREVILPINDKNWEKINKLVNTTYNFYLKTDSKTSKVVTTRDNINNYVNQHKELINRRSKDLAIAEKKRKLLPQASEIFNDKKSKIYYVSRYDIEAKYSSSNRTSGKDIIKSELTYEEAVKLVKVRTNEDKSRDVYNAVTYEIHKLTIEQIIEKLLKKEK